MTEDPLPLKSQIYFSFFLLVADYPRGMPQIEIIILLKYYVPTLIIKPTRLEILPLKGNFRNYRLLSNIEVHVCEIYS